MFFQGHRQKYNTTRTVSFHVKGSYFPELKCMSFRELRVWVEDCRPRSSQNHETRSSSEHLISRHSHASLHGDSILFSYVIFRNNLSHFSSLGECLHPLPNCDSQWLMKRQCK